MPQTGSREPSLAGGEKDTQQAANALEDAAEQFQDLTPNSPPEGVEFADSRLASDPLPSYADEDEEFLFGATDLPDEAPWLGAGANRPIPPKNIYRYLSSLVMAADDPEAPPELHAFIRILQEALSEGNEESFSVLQSEYALRGLRAPSRTEGLRQGQMPERLRQYGDSEFTDDGPINPPQEVEDESDVRPRSGSDLKRGQR